MVPVPRAAAVFLPQLLRVPLSSNTQMWSAADVCPPASSSPAAFSVTAARRLEMLLPVELRAADFAAKLRAAVTRVASDSTQPTD